jgi:RNA polymerase sigma-70 factor (ECF subfamily)
MMSTMGEPRDDLDLMLAAGKGDRNAYAELVERHHRTIVHFVHRFLSISDRATAEDIAQDVLLSAWKAAPTFKPKAAVLTWLLRITTNRCLNHKRSKARKPTVTMGDNAGYEPSDMRLSDRHPDAPDASMQADERAAQVRDAVAQLPPTQRVAIVLRHFHDLSYAEIAAVLVTSMSSVESLLFRARTTLKDRLGDLDPPKGEEET